MNIETTYLGLSLKNPIVAAASPLTRNIDGIKRLEDAGAAAVVLPSLFEEEIEHDQQFIDRYLDLGSDSGAEVTGFAPDPDLKLIGPEQYLKTIEAAKKAVSIPVIGSLNGATPGGWLRHAALIEEAGADAIELNLYYLPTDPEQPGFRIETQYIQTVQCVLSTVGIPVAVKISPYFSSLPNFVSQITEAGANGLVLFNRFYQPDIDVEKLEITPTLNLSRSEDLRLPLRWTAILSSLTNADIAISSGVHTHIDVLKSIMAGANVTMLASELLQNGVGRVSEILGDLTKWLEEHEYESVTQMRGSMNRRSSPQPALYERANYMKVLHSYEIGSLI